MTDQEWMGRALALAVQGTGWVNPNPLVGAVIVRDDHLIGEGYHQRWGGPHAERNALAACKESPRGATLYVTLEPCCHQGKTPPCTEAIIQAGLAQVVVGSRDPNPLVAGKGVARLRAAGIQVAEDVLRTQCDALNPFFFHYIRHQRPYVALKYAMTADGKTATVTGASRWVTREAARQHVHELRHRYSGIMVGVDTALADDPQLTCRLPEGRNPVRILCDSQLRLPLTSRLVQTAAQIPTIVATSRPSPGRQSTLEQQGVTVITCPGADGRVDLAALLDQLGQRGIDSLLVEGGGCLSYSLLAQGLVQKVYAYIAPQIWGGRTAPTPVTGAGVSLPQEGYQLSSPRITLLEPDILLEYDVITP